MHVGLFYTLVKAFDLHNLDSNLNKLIKENKNMGAGMIKGDVEQIQQSATKLGDFSTELNDTLTRLRGTVDDISAITYGTASETLTSTYYQLDNDLKTYVTELETLSKNVMTSSNNLESIDEAASSGLSYN